MFCSPSLSVVNFFIHLSAKFPVDFEPAKYTQMRVFNA